eukprot:COSAG02_NODE_3112_length_7339_cov_13.532182_5_plen_307_part_00
MHLGLSIVDESGEERVYERYPKPNSPQARRAQAIKKGRTLTKKEQEKKPLFRRLRVMLYEGQEIVVRVLPDEPGEELSKKDWNRLVGIHDDGDDDGDGEIEDEDNLHKLKGLVQRYGPSDWEEKAREFEHRTAKSLQIQYHKHKDEWEVRPLQVVRVIADTHRHDLEEGAIVHRTWSKLRPRRTLDFGDRDDPANPASQIGDPVEVVETREPLGLPGTPDVEDTRAGGAVPPEDHDDPAKRASHTQVAKATRGYHERRHEHALYFDKQEEPEQQLLTEETEAAQRCISLLDSIIEMMVRQLRCCYW